MMAFEVGRKMDFLELQKAFGEKNCEFDSVNKVVMCTFRRMENGNIAATSGGRTIYRGRGFEHLIREDETWFCELKQNPNISHQYFANPLLKVDASFLYDLRREQYDELLGHVWKEHRQDIESDLEMMYVDTLDEKAKAIASSSIREYEERETALRSDLAAIEAKVSDLMMDNEALVLKEEDHLAKEELYKDRILSLEERLVALEAERVKLMSALEMERKRSAEVPRKKHRVSAPESNDAGDLLIRTGVDTLYSSRFTRDRYKIRFASDMSYIKFIADENGDVHCKDGNIRVRGLEGVMPFDGMKEIRLRTISKLEMVVDL
jgi:hypothetical protein